ncbi:hypothetical protein [Streptomyces sp. NPDC094149]|uniref:hypothetical protein n=1 Tax=Streptomyces sp. NPDC094149 TaxID=3155079 RepID=UPI0033176E4A
MRTTRAAMLLSVLALLTAGGCGGELAAGGGPGSQRTSQARARAVAEAWRGSEAAEAWTKGYHPLGDVVQLPDGAFRTDADKRAYATENFVLRTTLPTVAARTGRVRWSHGGSLTLPLTGAREAYDSLARGGNDGPHLTVTDARLGETTLLTSRGPATVPAWLFTIEGYDTPLKRVALDPSRPAAPPIRPAAKVPSDELWPLGRLMNVARDGRSLTVIAEHGGCDEGPAVGVLETDDSVVLSASITGRKGGICTSEMIGEPRTVTLKRPLGDRILLDAFTGRPLTSPSGG